MLPFLTTGEAATICQLSQQSIIRCFDKGLLKGFRVPGSRFRRIPQECLYEFMLAHGIPTNGFRPGEPNGQAAAPSTQTV